ncbi:MAG: HAD hydrolase-like protein [Deltaproteobacteria bacterium]|nr:HAD hydrolase-like protein [Deltaproteobacteria bacterium]
MSTDPQAPLKAHHPAHTFFVGIDSDGCAFNSMEVKHNDCFSVNVVKHFGLSAVSRQVHQCWDFVNLYSQSRGCNRFKALLDVMDLLRDMPKVKAAGVSVPALPATRAWVKEETALGNPTLASRLAAASGEAKRELEQVMAWSLGVNAFVKDIVKELPPFAGTTRVLKDLQGKADVLVVSATPAEALVREWAEHGIDQYVRLIAGQEMGSKAEHLTLAAVGKYAADAILMVGDAPGDLKAARAVGALFFPINPGDEEESWARLQAEGLPRFFAKEYAGAYEAALVNAFMERLPSTPPWKV